MSGIGGILNILLCAYFVSLLIISTATTPLHQFTLYLFYTVLQTLLNLYIWMYYAFSIAVHIAI